MTEAISMADSLALQRAREEIGALLFESTTSFNFHTGVCSPGEIMHEAHEVRGECLDDGNIALFDFFQGASRGLWSKVEQQREDILSKRHAESLEGVK